MSVHIDASRGEIAETVLLSGDPLRAKHIAETLLSNSQCYSKTRNMLGFTGSYKGHEVSVQGTGMGQPSLAIYLHELIHTYGVKTAIRVGTCGALQKNIDLGNIIIGQGASTDASFNKLAFANLDFAPLPNPELFHKVSLASASGKIVAHVGNVFSTDLFYTENDPERWKVWIDHGILAVDMETAMLYTMATKHKIAALSILTVSDHIIYGKRSSAHEREKSFIQMAQLALDIL